MEKIPPTVEEEMIMYYILFFVTIPLWLPMLLIQFSWGVANSILVHITMLTMINGGK